MAKIDLPKGSGKRLKVREKSVKSQGILKWILSGNPEMVLLHQTGGPTELQMRNLLMPSHPEPLTQIQNNFTKLHKWLSSAEQKG